MNEEQAQALKLKTEGHSRKEIASIMGLSEHSVKRRLSAAKRWQDADPMLVEAALAGGASDPAMIAGGWKLVKDENGNGHSLRFSNPDTGQDASFADMVSGAVQDAWSDGPLPFEPRDATNTGDHLLVIDLADVHFGKLCVKTETGYTYNREVARHRVVEGTKALLNASHGYNIGRILFVMGNDILHVDGNDGKTTAGTNQDTDGSVFQMWSDAHSAITAAIKECAMIADVDLVHCMSNHDWKLGWTLSQSIAAGFAHWDTVNATEYNMSEAHRKYYGFENNAFLLTHGDGTKEEKLYGHFVTEARQLISSCKNIYALLHHVHHKIRKRRGVDVFQSEKDHNGMTAIMTGSHNPAETFLNIEYVRSPSPPDGWHDRNGYVNRQGVEAFIYHPTDGQKARITEWF